MKTTLITSNWLTALSLMATDSLIQGMRGIMALPSVFLWFGISCYYLHKYKRTVMIDLYLFEKRLLTRLKLN